MRSTSTRLSLLASFIATALASPINLYNDVSLFRRAVQCPYIDTPVGGCVPLLIGQKDLGATVCLSLDYNKATGETKLIVKYSDIVGFTYTDLHLFVGAPSDVLTNAPGQYPYTVANGACTTDGVTGTCTVPLGSTPPCGTTYKIAAHAATKNDANPLDTQTGWGAGECIKRNPKGDCAPWASYFTFSVACKDCPTDPPDTTTYCELGTGFGYNDAALTLISLGYNIKRWGWYIPVAGGTSTTGTIYVGAGKNDLSKGTNVGTFDITWSSSGTTVCYHLTAGYDLAEVHIDVGCSLPGSYAKSPGQYKFITTSSDLTAKNDVDFCHSFTNTDLGACASSGTQYYILHASVFVSQKDATCPTPAADE